MDTTQLIKALPKAELHMHIQGSLQPELLMKLAQKNKVQLKYKTVQELRNAYQFNNLQEFLDIYYQGMSVLQTQEDFYQLTQQYTKKCRQNNIVHAQIFFDPQAHLERGVSFQTVFMGIYSGLEDARKQGNFTFGIIMCFLRHLSQEDAFKTLQLSLPFKDKILGVGLDSTQVGNPAVKFEQVFKKAKQYGFRTVAHAGEQGPKQYIEDALKLLGAERIDHGIRCQQCQVLVNHMAEKQIPMTVCPLSNLKLKVVKQLSQHNLGRLLQKGLLVTINSDDPAYFGGYLNQNFIQIANQLKLTPEQIKLLAKNSFTASFIVESQKKYWISAIDQIN